MKKKNKILLVFPDGVGIRNYLYSDVFNKATDDLVLFHNFDENTINEISSITAIDTIAKIPVYKETILEKFLRELICLTRLKNNAKIKNNPTILTNWKTNPKSFKNKLFYKTIGLFAKFIIPYNQILLLEEKYQEAIRKSNFYKQIKIILEDIQPDLVFCSHQRGVQCAPIFAVAKDLGIQTTTVIYSWDNLPKARLALKADNYLVWSEYMKEEMKIYYPTKVNF